VEVKVRDNNVMQAFRKLKKKLHNEGVIQDIQDRQYYTKPSDKKRLKRKEAIRRIRTESAKRREAD
jgi:small subunit ribosomal protein S21